MNTRGTIAYFGHNVNDAAVRRRTIALQRAGYDVQGFMPRRGPAGEYTAPYVDLGETRDNAYGARLKFIFAGARLAAQHREILARADVIMARNLDMLAMAVRARHLMGQDTPILYECLDIHHKLSGTGRAAQALRALERWLLRRTALVLISSPAFEREHFARHYPGAYRCFLAENRLIEGDGFPPRPAPSMSDPRQPLRIGWFGNLRCTRSLGLLTDLARAFPTQVEIILRGYTARNVLVDFDAQIAPFPNIRLEGRYRAPQDLAQIYGEVDLIWSGDWYEDGANSLWLLPNRLYEGGYFGTPALAPSGTQTAHWLADKAGGFLIEEDVAQNLHQTVAALLEDRAPINALRTRLLALPREVFVEPPETMQALLAMATEGAASTGQAPSVPGYSKT